MSENRTRVQELGGDADSDDDSDDRSSSATSTISGSSAVAIEAADEEALRALEAASGPWQIKWGDGRVQELTLEGCSPTCSSFKELPAELGQLTALTTLGLEGCEQLTALPKELCDIPTLEEINAKYCRNIAVPPEAIVRQGLDAMRRYYAELEAASAASVTLKAVLMGPGEAGKTSLLRRLRDADAAVLPAASERTIGLEMTTMSLDPENVPKLKLLIYDFGGQPEYFPFHQLFLTPGALCIVVFDLSRDVDDCVHVIVEQFNILTMNAPLAVTMVVGTHLDQVVGGGAAAAAKLSAVKKGLEAWRAKQLKVRSKDRGDAPLDLPNFRWPIIAVDSTGMNDTVDAARVRIQELAFDETLFPAFRKGIPLAYERLRAALVAVTSGRDPVVEVQALSPGAPAEADAGRPRLDQQESWRSERYGGGADAAAGGVVVPYVKQSELLAIWQSTINDPALAMERSDIRSTPEEVFFDALLIFEGEGFLMISRVSGLVHLDPSWLADCVKPIADHRIQNNEHRSELVFEWTEKDDNLDEGDTIKMLDELAHNGVAPFELLKLMFADDDEMRGTLSLDKLLELFVEHYLLLPLDDTSYLLPMKLPSWPPEAFDQTYQLRQGQVAWGCECELRARYFPPGLFPKMFVALHGLGEFRTYFASGGVLQDEDQTRTLVFAFDPTTFVLLLRVHGKESIEAELRTHLEEAAEKAKQVFNHFKGLQGVVPKKYEYKTAHDDANAKLKALLEGHRAMIERLDKIENSLEKADSRLITLIKGDHAVRFRYFLLVPKPIKGIAKFNPERLLKDKMLLIPLYMGEDNKLRKAPVNREALGGHDGFEVKTPTAFVEAHPKLVMISLFVVKMALTAAAAQAGAKVGSLLAFDIDIGGGGNVSKMLEVIAKDALNRCRAELLDVNASGDVSGKVTEVIDNLTNAPAAGLNELLKKEKEGLTNDQYANLAKWLDDTNPGWETNLGLTTEPQDDGTVKIVPAAVAPAAAALTG